jgi:hypothetical protein
MSSRRILIVVVATCIGVASRPDPSSAKCAIQELAPLVLTPNEAQLPMDGGVLVAWGYETRGEQRDGDTSRPKDWTFSVAATPVTIAPDVTVYRPTKPGGKLTITDGKHQQLASFAIASKAPPSKLVAPAPTAIRRQHHKSKRSAMTTVTAELADAPPADAFAVITYRGKAAIDFFVIERDDKQPKSVDVHRDPGRCRFLPTGIQTPNAGEEVTLAWVDNVGRVGPQSKPIKVTAAPGTSDDD